ncbi:MAG: hypothetical protein QOH93_2602 [Chloroflexia bacterium]|nr:hypothetical protein [Chloroflexia bacterium]
MTVRQVGRQTFNASRAIVADQTRLILNTNAAYKNVRELTPGAVFALTVKPSRLVLGTSMEIELAEDSSGTTVTATATSQPAIYGDIGGFYYRYVRDFLAALQQGLQTTQGSQPASSAPEYKMQTGCVGIIYTILLALFLAWMFASLHIPFLRLFIALVIVGLIANVIRIVRGGRLGA